MDGEEKSFSNYLKRNLIGYASDGESVMAGQQGGLISYFRNNAEHFIYSIHCMAHRLELVIEKAMKKVPYFKNFENFINKLFQFYNWNNSKRKSHLKETADKMKLKMYALNYIYHTRWISSELQSITNLKKMWKLIVMDLEIISDSLSFDQNTRDLAHDLSIQIKGKRFLAILHFISDILHHLSFWSLKMQERTALLVDFSDFNEKVISTFEGLKITNGRDLNFFLMSATCDEVDPCNNLNNYYDAQSVSYENQQLIQDIEEENIPVPLISDIRTIFFDEIIKQFKAYFPNSDLKIFKIFLPKNMPEHIGEALTHGVVELNNLCSVFKMNDCLKLVREWTDLLVSIIDSPNFCTLRTSNVETYVFWSKLLNNPEIQWTEMTTKLIRNILVLPIASAEAERGFSIFNHAKTSRRSQLSRGHIEDILRIRINAPDDIEKFAAYKYAKKFIDENHFRTDDPRNQRKKPAASLLEEDNVNKKFLPKLSFI